MLTKELSSKREDTIFTKLPSLDSWLDELEPDASFSMYRGLVERMEKLDETSTFKLDFKQELKIDEETLEAIENSDGNDEELEARVMESYLNWMRPQVLGLRMTSIYCPWLAETLEWENDPDDSNLMTFRLKLAKPPEQIRADRLLIDSKVNEIVSSLPVDLTEFEKISHFHNWLLDNVEYGDIPQTAKESHEFYDQTTAKGVFIDGKAICGGFAHAMKMLCDATGIYCLCIPVYVNGADYLLNSLNADLASLTGISTCYFKEQHVLCFIIADGKPFYCDPVTTLDRINDWGDENESRQFGLAMSLDDLQHFGCEPRWEAALAPEETVNEYTAPLNYGYYFGHYDSQAALKHIVDVADKGWRRAFFKFETTDELELCFQDLMSLESSKELVSQSRKIVAMIPYSSKSRAGGFVEIFREPPLLRRELFDKYSDVIITSRQIATHTDRKLDESWWLYRNQLNEVDKRFYDKVALLVADGHSYLRNDEDADVGQVYKALLFDEPAMRWFYDVISVDEDVCQIRYFEVDRNSDSDFYLIDEPISKLREEIEIIKRRLPSAASQKDLALEIYRYICVNSSTDSLQEFLGKHPNGILPFVFDSPLKGLATSIGTARLFTVMCRIAGIECQIVPGVSKKGYQTWWNIIRVDETFFNICHKRSAGFYAAEQAEHQSSMFGLTDESMEALGFEKAMSFETPICNDGKFEAWHEHVLPTFELKQFAQECLVDIRKGNKVSYFRFESKLDEDYGCTRQELQDALVKAAYDDGDTLSAIIHSRSCIPELNVLEIFWTHEKKV